MKKIILSDDVDLQRFVSCLWLVDSVVLNFRAQVTTNQRHYTDLCRATSSVWILSCQSFSRELGSLCLSYFIFQTFIVIASRFGTPHVHRLNKAKSVYIFGQNHPFRKFSLYITTNQYPFDKVTQDDFTVQDSGPFGCLFASLEPRSNGLNICWEPMLRLFDTPS